MCSRDGSLYFAGVLREKVDLPLYFAGVLRVSKNKSLLFGVFFSLPPSNPIKIHGPL
jgi:hypothetical protein